MNFRQPEKEKNQTMYRAAKLYGWIEISYYIMIQVALILLIAAGIYRPSQDVSWLEFKIMIELLIIAHIWNKFSPFHLHRWLLQHIFACMPKQAKRAKKWYRAAQKQAGWQNKKRAYLCLWKTFVLVLVIAMASSYLFGWLYRNNPNNPLWNALSNSWLKNWFIVILPMVYNNVPVMRLLSEHEKRKSQYVQAA